MNRLPWLATDGSPLLVLAFAAGFILISLAIGRRLLKLCGVGPESTSAERLVIAACAAAGLLQFVPFVLGAAGQLSVSALRIAALVTVLIALPDTLAVVRSGLAMARGKWRSDSWLIVWLIALGPAVAIATLIALTPSIDPDGLAYHLTVPKRWMSSGHLDYLPTYPYSNAPMGVEMLFAWAMSLAGDSAAKCVHLILGLLAAMAVFLAGKRLRGRMTGAVSATLFLVAPSGAAVVLGYSYVEGGAALATACATLAWLIWFQTDARSYLRVAAVIAGVSVSFKISAALFPVALGALTFLAMYDRHRNAGPLRSFATALAASAALIPLVVAPVAPWFARAFLLTGNPFFPVLASRIPSRDLSFELAAQIDNYTRYMTWGHANGPQLNLEQRAHLLLAVAVAALLAGMFAWFKLRSWMARSAVVIVTFTAIAQLLTTGLYIRYSLPLAAALMLPVVALFERWFTWRPVMYAWIAVTLSGSLMQARRSLVEEGRNLPGLAAAAIGVQDRKVFLEERLPLLSLYERINHELPADARIVLSDYCGGFYIDRTTFCSEMVQDSLRFTTWEEFISDLRRLGVTHVVAPVVFATGGPSPVHGGSSVSELTRAGQEHMMRLLLTQHSRTLQTATDLGLFEIEPGWLARKP